MRYLLVLLFVAAVVAAARADDDLPLPRGSHADGGAYRSGDGFRPTIDLIARSLDHRGLVFHEIGPYRAHGVDVARFVLDDARAPWLAIHVYRADGKTWISFVKRSP